MKYNTKSMNLLKTNEYKMTIDFERSLLYGIAIVAVGLAVVGVIFAILGITQGDAIITNDCIYACGSLPQIMNEDCIKDRSENCTPFRPYNTDYATFQISDTQISYWETCQGLCDGTVTSNTSGFVCNSTECAGGNCPYYSCLNEFNPSSNNCNSLSNPIACANNTVYYPYKSFPLGTVYEICVCRSI